MARLVLTAVSSESTTGDTLTEIEVLVSVSRATNGKPVTGLTKDNFRVASSASLAVNSCSERRWDPTNPAPTQRTGFYMLSIGQTPSAPFIKGEIYAFGIQVRTFKGKTVIDSGQSVISMESLGT
jgi:hypothetical protein